MKIYRCLNLLAAIGCFSYTAHVRAQVPQLINYQGRVVVSGTNFTGTGQFKFALVSGTSAATSYWSNDGTSTAGSQPTSAVSVTVSRGLYSLALGDTTLTNMTAALPYSVFGNSDVRLRVWFNDDTDGWQQLSPDQRIAAMGYAMVANNSTTSGSAASSGFATVSGSSANSGSATFAITSGSSANSGTSSYATTSGSSASAGTATYVTNPTLQAAIYENSSFSAAVGNIYMVDTTSGTVGATLPASPSVGQRIQFMDSLRQWPTNAFIVAANGQLVNGGTSNGNPLASGTIVNGQWVFNQWGTANFTYTGTSYGWACSFDPNFVVGPSSNASNTNFQTYELVLTSFDRGNNSLDILDLSPNSVIENSTITYSVGTTPYSRLEGLAMGLVEYNSTGVFSTGSGVPTAFIETSNKTVLGTGTAPTLRFVQTNGSAGVKMELTGQNQTPAYGGNLGGVNVYGAGSILGVVSVIGSYDTRINFFESSTEEARIGWAGTGSGGFNGSTTFYFNNEINGPIAFKSGTTINMQTGNGTGYGSYNEFTLSGTSLLIGSGTNLPVNEILSGTLATKTGTY